jgi:hypothetical protein
MTEPILLICGCQKYKSSLEKAIIRFTNPAYRVIGILGDIVNPTQFNGSILSLQVDDTYEALPRKIQAAFRWIDENFSSTAGVFKTDDDIFFDDQGDFVKTILDNTSIPYWGVKQQVLKSGLVRTQQVAKYTNPSEKLHYPGANYIWGHGYWISKSVLPIITKGVTLTKGPEDVLIGSLLNKAGYVPKEIYIKYREAVRHVKCERTTCSYKIHTNSSNNSGLYCCMMCQLNRNHGPACEKIIYINKV